MSKNQYTINILLLCLSTFFSYCKKDWLEIKSQKNQAIPESLNDLQAILDQARMNNEVIALGEIAADGHYVTEGIWSSSVDFQSKNSYTWSNQFTYPYILGWNNTYERIFNNNIVLDGLSKVKIITQPDKAKYDDIRGQALFNRADAYLSLAQLFIPPYAEETASADKGLPLRLNSDITEPSKRSSVQQTYNLIINDIKASLALLPSKALAPTRGSKAAACALLARAYLSMRKYDSAGFYANKCLGFKDTLLDYNLVPESDEFISGGSTFNPEVIFFTTVGMGAIDDYLTNNYLIDEGLYLLYNNNDLRKSRFFKKDMGQGIISFKGNYFNSNSPLFSGLATDEIYLIRAESNARANKPEAALSDLNHLLIKRWNKTQNYVPVVAENAAKALEIILQERRKELVLRNIRWSDLRRLNKETAFQTTLQRTIGGTTYKLEPGSYRYTFPFPDNVITISGMPQNTGW